MTQPKDFDPVRDAKEAAHKQQPKQDKRKDAREQHTNHFTSREDNRAE